jgi:hypothetical protein
MESIKKTYILLLLASALLWTLEGCVGADLEECPPSVRYSLAFKYLIHQEYPADLFTRDVNHIKVYAFDAATGLLVADTTVEPHWTQGAKNDFILPLSLAAGDYNIITWGWGHEELEEAGAAVQRCVPTTGSVTRSTRMPEAALRVPSNNDTIEGRIERTFYGLPSYNGVQQYIVTVPQFTTRTDTVELKNIAHRLRIVIENAKDNEIRVNDWKNSILVSIKGNNDTYSFDAKSYGRSKLNPNNPAFPDTAYRNGPFFDPSSAYWDVTYKPHSTYTDDAILAQNQIFTWGANGAGLDSALIVDVASLRMIAGDEDLVVHVDIDREEPYKIDDLQLLNIDANDPTGESDGVIVRDFKRYFQATYYREPTIAEIQKELDSHYEFVLFVKLPQNWGDTYMTASVHVLNWQVVDQGSDAGNSDVKF